VDRLEGRTVPASAGRVKGAAAVVVLQQADLGAVVEMLVDVG
jgi:hypothetical protein